MLSRSSFFWRLFSPLVSLSISSILLISLSCAPWGAWGAAEEGRDNDVVAWQESIGLDLGASAGATLGRSLALLGDVDGDGTDELLVGLDDAVLVVFMNDERGVRSAVRISSVGGSRGGLNTSFPSGAGFGFAVSSLGDLNDDGIPDAAVGIPWYEPPTSGLSGAGAVIILFLERAGTVKSEVLLTHGSSGLGNVLKANDHFGFSLATLSLDDDDTTTELAVGSDQSSNEGGDGVGAVFVLFLDRSGAITSKQKITTGSGGFTGTDLAKGVGFGCSLGNLGTFFTNRGGQDIAVGARFDSAAGSEYGAVWILGLHADGMMRSSVKIEEGKHGFQGKLGSRFLFGNSVAGIGDNDGDKIPVGFLGFFAVFPLLRMFLTRTGLSPWVEIKRRIWLSAYPAMTATGLLKALYGS
jgi:hypothetical protein